MKGVLPFVLLLAVTYTTPGAAQRVNAERDVDPFIGIDGGGNVIPGPSMPFGMAKPGPDTGYNAENAGWEPNGDINGFSQTHVSGTGGGASYGNILVQPTTGEVTPSNASSPRANERGALGLYSVDLKRFGVHVDVTAASRASLYRFVFPQAQQANLLFDVGHVLSSGITSAENQVVTNATVEVVSPTEVRGSTTVQGGWNKHPAPYTVYFDALADTPAASWGTWKNGTAQPGNKADSAEQPSEHGNTLLDEGSWLRFATTQGQSVLLKVGLSFISTAQAKRNAETGIPGFDFDAARARLIRAWNMALGPLEIEGATAEQRRVFYTALYHSMLMPVDRTGENPRWQSDQPSYDDFYTIWDTFRSNNPLLTLLAPDRETAIVRSLIDVYKHQGWMPDGRIGNYNGRTQGGSDADFVLADAYVKGLQVDWEEGYRALVKDAERTPWDQFKEGRGDLEEWRALGYLSVEGVDRPASKHMEYAGNDYAVALVAKGLGKDADYRKYLARSENWKNLWDKSFEDEGFSGFIRPRHEDGSWYSPFTARDSGTWYGHNFYEGDSWTYSLFVPQDVRGLMEMCGGKDRFVARLDRFFDGGHFDIGNEPGFLTPYLYIWAGRHDKTAERVRAILSKGFTTSRGGLPGNDDSGAMSSLYVLGRIGLFPNAGQDVYLIGSPTFPVTTIHLADGKDFRIEARATSDANKYVTAAMLNGKPLDRAWLRHQDIVAGGSLVLSMSDKPGPWPQGTPPPSSSDTIPDQH